MKRKTILRPLRPGMDDCYTRAELYAVFAEQVFRGAKRMDAALLAETARALDDRPDEEAAPHRELVWRRITARLAEPRRTLSRQGTALLAFLLALLLAGAALAMIDWHQVFESVHHLERRESRVEDWTPEQRRQIVSLLESAGYDMDTLPALDGLSTDAQDAILTRWLKRQMDGAVSDGFYNLLIKARGMLDGWSLQDKAWFYRLLIENGEVSAGTFVCDDPPEDSGETEAALLRRAWALARELYGDSAAEVEGWTAYLFYGYVYPENGTHYWRVHFRNDELENWFTVQAAADAPDELIIVMQRPIPPDVG